MRNLLVLALFALFLVPVASFAQSHSTVSSVLDVSALRQGQSARLAVVVEIADGYHAQSHAPLDDSLIKCELKLDPVPGVEFGQVVYPAGGIENYPQLGKLSVYTGRTIIIVPITITKDAPLSAIKVSGTVEMQICDQASCFPPESDAFDVESQVVPDKTPVQSQHDDLFPKNAATQPVKSESPPPTQPASSDHHFSVLGFSGNIDSVFGGLMAAFVAGLIFNVMPCVLPVLPLKAIGFYEVSQHDRKKTILLGFVFSLGVIAAFAVLAMLILLSKQVFGRQFSWGQQFSSPVFVWMMSLVLVALGIGMLGVFAIRLPVSVYGLNFRHDTLGGNFMWGGLTAVLSTPCTAPLFPVVIGFSIAQPAAIGVGIMLMVGVGMAFPYFLLSAFPGVARSFPRTGPISEVIKQMMSFLLFGTAAFFIGSTLSFSNAQAGLICLVAVSASFFLIGRTWQITKNNMGRAIACCLALLITSTAVWAALPRDSRGEQVAWVEFSQSAFDQARAEHRTILVKFTAKWCANCVVLEKTVYREPQVIDAIRDRNIIAMKLDVDKVGWELLNQLAPAAGIPFTALYLPGKDQPLILASMHDTQMLMNFLSAAS